MPGDSSKSGDYLGKAKEVIGLSWSKGDQTLSGRRAGMIYCAVSLAGRALMHGRKKPRSSLVAVKMLGDTIIRH